MQKIKDVLRLHLLGGVSSCRQLARAAGCGKSAVAQQKQDLLETIEERYGTGATIITSQL